MYRACSPISFTGTLFRRPHPTFPPYLLRHLFPGRTSSPPFEHLPAVAALAVSASMLHPLPVYARLAVSAVAALAVSMFPGSPRHVLALTGTGGQMEQLPESPCGNFLMATMRHLFKT